MVKIPHHENQILHSTQHTAHSTQHTAHSTQHTAHSTQHTAHSTNPSWNNVIRQIFLGFFIFLGNIGFTQQDCTIELECPTNDNCTYERSPRVECESEDLPLKLEIRIETDYEFCSKFASKGEMEQYVHYVFEEINTEFFTKYFNLTIEVIGDISWWTENNDPYTYQGNNTNSGLIEFAIRYSSNHPCQPRDMAMMFSGRNLGPQIGLSHPEDVSKGDLKMCGEPKYGGKRVDFAIVTRMDNNLGEDVYNIVAHEIIHNFGLAHLDEHYFGLPNIPPGCNPSNSCIAQNCSMMCSQVCPTGWKNLECFLQAQLWNNLKSYDCLREDVADEYCEYCYFQAKYVQDRKLVLLNSCVPEGDELVLDITVCNDQCEGKNIDMGMTIGSTTLEIISSNGFNPYIGTMSLNGNTFNAILNDEIFFNAGECKSFELKVRIINSPNENFLSRLYINGISPFEDLKVNVIAKNTQPKPVGNISTPTTLSSLITNNIHHFGLATGTCDNSGPHYPFNVKVKGELILDVDYKFKGNYFEMEEGSKITITNGAKICFEEVTMYSCEGMWHGIDVEDEGAISIVSSTIYDAWNAVEVFPTSYYHIENNTFENNYVGLRLNGTGLLNGSPFPILNSTSLLNNKFVGTNLLKDTYSIQGNQTGSSAYAGIYLDNHIDELIVNNTHLFKGMQYGIYSDHSMLLVDGALFEDIIPQSELIYPIAKKFGTPKLGTGVYGMNNSIIKVNGNGDEVIFDNCKWGIVVHESRIDAQDIRFENVYNGIGIHYLTTGKNNIIKNNNINYKYTGVELYYSNPVELSIIDNVFFSVSDFGRGISIQDNLLGHSIRNMVIENNEFYLRSYGTGLFMNGPKEYLVTNNRVYFTDQVEPQIGTYLVLGEENQFKCNKYKPLGANDDFENAEFIAGSGLIVENAPGNLFQCELFGVVKSMFFNGICDGTLLKGDQSWHHESGLELTSQAVIGLQHDYGNTWNSNESFEVFFNTSNKDLIEASSFRVKNYPSFLPRWKTLISNENNPSAGKWFLKENNNQFECVPESCEGSSLIDNEGTWRKLDSLLVLEDEDLFSDLKLGTIRNSEWQLYDRIRNGYYIDTPAIALTFKQEFESSTQFPLFQALRKLRQYFTPDSNWLATSDHLDSLLERKNILLHEIQSLDSTNIVGIDSINAMIDILTISYSTLYPMYETIDSIEMVRRTTILNQAISNLGNTHTDEPTQNMDDVLTWWHYMLSANELLKDSCRNALEDIALQCPDEGGIAVYISRSLLESWAPYHFDDHVICGSQQQAVISEIDRINNNHSSRIQLIPNPASGTVNLTLSSALIRRLRLIGVSGYVGYDQLFEGQSQVDIDLSGLMPGIYITEVETTSKQLIYAKLVIQ